MNPKAKSILGWVLTGLLALLAVGSAVGKLTATPDNEMGQEFIKMGFFDGRFLVASLELIAIFLLLVPRTSALGVVVSAGYWGGAYAVHVAHADYFPVPVFVAMALLGGIALLRTPELFLRVQGRSLPS